jgi:hypothetical protein
MDKITLKLFQQLLVEHPRAEQLPSSTRGEVTRECGEEISLRSQARIPNRLLGDQTIETLGRSRGTEPHFVAIVVIRLDEIPLAQIRARLQTQ